MIIFQLVLKPGVVSTPVNYTVHHQSFPVLISVCRKMQVYEAAIAEAQADGGISQKDTGLSINLFSQKGGRTQNVTFCSLSSK